MEASEEKAVPEKMNNFMFFRSNIEAMVDLQDKDRLKLFDAICKYGLDGEESELKGTCKALFCAFKPSLDNSRNRIKSGALGGRARKLPLKPAEKLPLKQTPPLLETERRGEGEGEDIYTEKQATFGIQGALAADQAQADQALSGTDPVTMPEALGWAARIGMAPAEVSRWFDYWGMRSWIPNGASRPMDRAAALRSMKPWNERRHEFKPSDERELGRGDNYDAPSPEDWNK